MHPFMGTAKHASMSKVKQQALFGISHHFGRQCGQQAQMCSSMMGFGGTLLQNTGWGIPPAERQVSAFCLRTLLPPCHGGRHTSRQGVFACMHAPVMHAHTCMHAPVMHAPLPRSSNLCGVVCEVVVLLVITRVQHLIYTVTFTAVECNYSHWPSTAGEPLETFVTLADTVAVTVLENTMVGPKQATPCLNTSHPGNRPALATGT